jgi:hypothetical protein
MTKKIIIDPCAHCGESTAFGYGRFVNRIGYDDGWACAQCSGYECESCEKDIYLDAEVRDRYELGFYHPWCLAKDLWHEDYRDEEEYEQATN